MSYSEVVQFWCPPYDCYKLNVDELEHSKTSIIIEGARGSGKTMLLKHLSYFCVKEEYKESSVLSELIKAEYLGVYFRYSADYSSLFEMLRCTNASKNILFDRYFQLSMSIELCKVLIDFESEIEKEELDQFYAAMKSTLLCECNSLQGLLKILKEEIAKQDIMIKRSQYEPIDEASISSMDNVLFSFIENIHLCIKRLSSVLFLLIIDEYENIGEFQRIINSYIRQTEGEKNYSFRIGVRPSGIYDYMTNISNESIQENRDFIRHRLIIDKIGRSTEFSLFVREVTNRRLMMTPLFRENNTDIVDILGFKEDLDLEAKVVVGGKKKHFDEITGQVSSEEAENIIGALSNDNALVEAYHIMRYKRKDTVEKIVEARDEYLRGDKTAAAKKYSLDFKSKYRAALLFWLIDKYKAKKMYYSFTTYLYLSSGSIYDFIGLCRTLFDELESEYYERLRDSRIIPMKIQTLAAQKYAYSQLEKIKYNHEYGKHMWCFVQNLCSVFSYYHKADLCLKYPETNQFFIAGDIENPGSVNGDIWASLIKWGVVISKNNLQRATLTSKRITQLYYINKVFYPIYGISCRFRGGFNYALTEDAWNHMIRTTSEEPEYYIKKKENLAKQTNDLLSRKDEDAQKEQQLTMADIYPQFVSPADSQTKRTRRKVET